MTENRIKVLHLGLSPNRGGIENVVHSWWSALDADDVTFDFVNVYDEPIAFEDEFRSGGSSIHCIPARKSSPKRHGNALREAISEGNYDFVHCHVMSLSEPEPVVICNELRLPTNAIVHSHIAAPLRTMSMGRRILHLYGKTALRRLDYLKVACGREAGRIMFGTDDFEVIENGIDIDAFHFSMERRLRFRREHGIPEDAFVVGHIGRPGRQKNYPFLIEAFAEVLRIEESAILLLVGAVENDAGVQSLVDEHGIREHCVFTGMLDSTSDCYSAMDVFLFPSLFEGFSVSVIEAQASGLECVLSDRISREHAVSDFVAFLPIDDARAVALKVCARGRCAADVRADKTLGGEYRLENTAREMLRYYRLHVIGNEYE